MNKNIQNLNIPEENKILLSKIDKRISYLSEKTQEYFDNSIYISSKKIEEAYTMNKDLVLILREKNDLIKEFRNNYLNIIEKNKKDFTQELDLKTEDKIDEISLINNTLDNIHNFVKFDDKSDALEIRRKYIKKKTKKRKNEMNKTLSELESKINEGNMLSIVPMKEDVELIKMFIDKDEVCKTKKLYLIPTFIFLVSIILIGGLIWLILV